MFDLQKHLDTYLTALNADEAKAAGQMTLGGLMDALKLVPSDTPVRLEGGSAPGELESYRGIYAQLSIQPAGDNLTAEALLAACAKVQNQTLTGYKGGDFFMDRGTFLNVAPHSCCGEKLVGVEMRGPVLTLLTAPDED